MSKAILILDEKPESCMECDIFNHEYLTCLGCKVHFKDVGRVQSWCPLRPLPQKRTPKENGKQGLLKLAQQYSDIGFNACLDEITGEMTMINKESMALENMVEITNILMFQCGFTFKQAQIFSILLVGLSAKGMEDLGKTLNELWEEISGDEE